MARIAAETRLAATFETEFGRPPRPGELVDLVLGRHDELFDDPSVLAQAMIRQHDLMAEKLNRFYMQVIHVDGCLPGLVLGDTPVVHAHSATGRYGFRDRLALLDGTLLVGPLTRHVAACFTARPLASVTISTHRALDALFVRSAAAEVACHPDDARRLQQVPGRPDRLPPELFLRLGRG